MSAEKDLALLQRFEPVMHFTSGEQFFPLDVARYVQRCSLWVQKPELPAERLVPEGQLSLQELAAPRSASFGAVHYLKFIEPLNVAALAAYRLRVGLTRKDPKEVFHAGLGRLARVGYVSRFLDALFSLTLLARGRVPGDTAAAAAVTYKELLEEKEIYTYHGRVLRRDGWVVLQYWYFYPFNDWRSSFYGANDHEADWEMVCLFLYEDVNGEVTPEWAAYASHYYSGDDIRRRWDDPELEKVGEHPVVYVGAGSHASYFQRGEYLTELELSFLTPVARMAARLQKTLRRALRTENNNAAKPISIFRVPFVDYARGDGISIGAGQHKTWTSPVLLAPTPAWVKNYRGLWGLYARDPVPGENAPAGPMYNHDGTVRRAWYDPIGWAGLDKILPPPSAAERARQRQWALEARREELRSQIEAKSRELRGLGLEVKAMRDHPHLRELAASHQAKIETLSTEIDAMRAELATEEALQDALSQYAEVHEEGMRGPARGHLNRPHQPTSDEGLRVGLIAEAWAAISIGLAMIAVVGIILFARQYLFIGISILVSLMIFVEASFRQRLARLITSVTVGLAFMAALVLLFEFFWQIVVVGVLFAGAYIMWENLRELWR